MREPFEPPIRVAKRLGLPVEGSTYLSWPALLELAVLAYWDRRPNPQQRKAKVAA